MHICTLGGGTAQAGILQSLSSSSKIDSLTGIVCTTDNGGSSAMVRSSLGIPSPGDVRNCINHTNPDGKQDPAASLLAKLLNYRFKDGELSGTHLGNLIIGALSRIGGDYESGILKLESALGYSSTKIFPVSNQATQVGAALEDGTKVIGERQIIKRENSSPIESFFLENSEASATESVIGALEKADMLIVCPGVLGTAIISTLLHDGISTAIQSNPAMKIVYFSNLFTYPNQTDGYTVSDHVNLVEQYIPRQVDHLITTTEKLPEDLIIYYKENGHDLVPFDPENISESTKIHTGNFASYPGKDLGDHERATGAGQHVGTHLLGSDKEKVREVIEKLISFGT